MSVVVFDFDKTLTYHDTWHDFLFYSGRRKSFFRIHHFLYIVFFLLQKFHLISNYDLKRLGVWFFLNGMEIDNLNRYAQSFSLQLRMNQVYKSCFQHAISDKSKSVIVVSASLGNYMKGLTADAKLICSELRIINNKVAGLARHAYRLQKMLLLAEMQISHIDEFYTDSIDDLDLVRISELVYLVNGDSIQKIDSADKFITYYKSIHRSKIKSLYKIVTAQYQNI